jgi:hypothetical protein
LDPVWFQVLRNHPELQVGPDGKQVSLPRNHNLRSYLNAASSLDCNENFFSELFPVDENAFCGISIDGKLYAYQSKNMKTLKETMIRSSLVTFPTSLLPSIIPVYHPVMPGSFFMLKEQILFDQTQILTNYSNQTNISLSNETVNDMILLKSRVVLLGLDLFVENLAADPPPGAGKKAAPAKAKGALDIPPAEIKPRKVYKYRIVIFDIFQNLSFSTAASGSTTIPFIKFERIHDFYLENITVDNNSFQDYLSNDEMNDVLSSSIISDLSCDGRILNLIIHENNYSQCTSQLYDLTKPKEYILLNNLSQLLGIEGGKKLPGVKEEKDDDNHSIHSAAVQQKGGKFSPRGKGGDGGGLDTGPLTGDTAFGDVDQLKEEDPIILKNPFLISQWKVNPSSSASEQKKLAIKKIIILLPIEKEINFFSDKTNSGNVNIPPSLATASSDTNATSPATSSSSNVILIDEERLKYYSKLSLLLIPNGFPFVLFYKMSSLKPDYSLASFYGFASANVVPVGKDAKKPPPDAKKGKGDKEDPNANSPNFPYSIFEVKRWPLSSSVTVWNVINGSYTNKKKDSNGSSFNLLSSYREYIVFGQMDGIITVWNIYKDNLINVLGKHPSPITSLTSYRNDPPSSISSVRLESTLTVVAGALDGTITIYSNKSFAAPVDGDLLGFSPSLLPFSANGSAVPSRQLMTSNISLKTANSVSSVTAPVFRDVKKGIAINEFKLIDFRHDSGNDSIVKIEMTCVDHHHHHGEEYLHLVVVQYLSGMIAIYVLQNYTKFHLVHSINNNERINYETFHSIFLSSLHLPLSSFRIPEKAKETSLLIGSSADENASIGTKEGGGGGIPPSSSMSVGGGGENDNASINEEASVVKKPEISDLFNRETLISTLFTKYSKAVKEQGKLLNSLSYSSVLLPNSSSFFLHLYRNGVINLNKYSIAFSEDILTMETNYNVEYLDLNAIADMRNHPPMTTAGKMSKVKERMPSTSASTMNKEGDYTSPPTVPYRSMKLTEERLLEHEKSFHRSSNHGQNGGDAFLPSKKNSQNILQMELNNSFLPVDIIKSELWQAKKTRGNNKGKLSKRLTMLGNLC